MKTPQALLTAIAAAALSFAVVIGTAATMTSGVGVDDASAAQQPTPASVSRMAFSPNAHDGVAWNADCDVAL